MKIDRIWVKDLEKEFGIGKTALYDRFAALGITPVKDGRRAYVSGDQFTRLVDLDEDLKRGGTLPKVSGDNSPDKLATVEAQNPSLLQIELVGLSAISAIADALHPPNPVADYFKAQDYLEQAALKKRILPTWLVKELTGSTPKGGLWQWKGGFEFTRVGKGWWRVKSAGSSADLT